jgi:galactose mutarotase-like enzyme
MKFTHREEERAGRLLDVLTDEERGLRIIVSRLGAELVSLARRDGEGNWIGFLYRGREIRGGTHSFLRHKLFTDVSAELGKGESAVLTYRISPNEIEPQEYPLKVSFALTYTLRGDALHVGFHFENHEPELTAHLEFGLHPGFAATSFDTFQLEMPAGRYRRWFSPGNYLTGETEGISFAGGKMPFDRAQLPGSYILEFILVHEPIFIFRDPPSGRRVTLNFAEVPYFTLWSDGGPFLCVEPCWGLTDRHEQRAFENKDGIQKIAPRGEISAGFTIQPETD